MAHDHECQASLAKTARTQCRTYLDAKELTHGAYERRRCPGTSQAERTELETYQKKVNELIATPPGASEIEEFPRKNG